MRNFIIAIEDFTKSIELDEKYADAYIQRAVVKAELGDYRGALIDNNKALELDSRNIEIYRNNIFVKMQMQKYQEAILDCDHVLEKEPNNALIFVQRGDAKLASGDKNGACLDWHNAVNLGFKEILERINKNCN
jgi:tetratricopeptide (TPR) repeat protein